MPLPDAPNTSPRIYTLLQNTDLENVTYANIASLGNPITAEELNEDELRRLVLVNVARMCIAGEWNGLLTAASGGASVVFPKAAMGSGFDQWQITNLPPYYGGGSTSTETFTSNYQFYTPFIAPKSGDISEMGIIQGGTVPGSTEYLYGAIYDSDTDNMPDSLLGYATFDISVGGTQYQTSFSATPTLVEGTMYYLAFSRNASTSANFEVWGSRPQRFSMNDAPGGWNTLLTNQVSTGTPPASAPAANSLYTYNQSALCVTVVIT